MLSFNQKLQYPLKPIFREYITKFMNQYTQSAHKTNTSLLITNAPLKYVENSDDNNSPYPSSKFWGGLIFLSVSTGIYLIISRKK
jgi:hypothetical protein